MSESNQTQDKALQAAVVVSVMVFLFGGFLYLSRTPKKPPPRRGTQKIDLIGMGHTGDQMLGVYITVADGMIAVESVIEGSNAERAGILRGDRLVAMDGKDLELLEGDDYKTLNQVLDRLETLRKGDVLKLKIRRPDAEGKLQPPQEIVVRFDDRANLRMKLNLAKQLIKKGVEELVGQRRSEDGWWPHYQRADQPSVGVTALAAYALRCAGDELEEHQRTELKAVLNQLIEPENHREGGLFDPRHPVAQHRVYANGLLLMALQGGDPVEGGRAVEAYQAASRAVSAWLVQAQVQEAHSYDRIDARYGGWSYYDDYRSPNLRTDISTARYALQALAEVERPATDPVWFRAGLYLDLVQNLTTITAKGHPLHARERKLRDGGFAFTPRMSKAGEDPVTSRDSDDELLVWRSYGSSTADGLLSLLATRGIDRRDSTEKALPGDTRVLAALRWLARNYTLDEVPGFGNAGGGWQKGLYYYYLAALAEGLHRAGVWKVVRDDKEHKWAEDVIAKLGANKKDPFKNEADPMHEDSPSIAASFAVIALSAARDRLALGSGSTLKAEGPPARPPRVPTEPEPLPSDVVQRGLVLFKGKAGCVACHQDTGVGNGPKLIGVGDVYLGVAGSLDKARARLKRFVRDPQGTRALLGFTKGDMDPQKPDKLSDADLDAIVEFLLDRQGNLPVSAARPKAKSK